MYNNIIGYLFYIGTWKQIKWIYKTRRKLCSLKSRRRNDKIFLGQIWKQNEKETQLNCMKYVVWDFKCFTILIIKFSNTCTKLQNGRADLINPYYIAGTLSLTIVEGWNINFLVAEFKRETYRWSKKQIKTFHLI